MVLHHGCEEKAQVGPARFKPEFGSTSSPEQNMRQLGRFGAHAHRKNRGPGQLSGRDTAVHTASPPPKAGESSRAALRPRWSGGIVHRMAQRDDRIDQLVRELAKLDPAAQARVVAGATRLRKASTRARNWCFRSSAAALDGSAAS